jgi:hypothetical protein
MKKLLSILIIIAALGIILSACGWRPSVQAVVITPPWSAMNLPVKENAVVWASSEKEFKAAHKEDKKTVIGKYVDALKAEGWTVSSFDDKSKDTFWIEMAKASDKIQIEIYDFENTGVIIKKL